jgi:hypothetical protein
MADKKDAPVAPAKPDFYLVVVHPFGDYRRGDSIADAGEMTAVLASENSRNVHRVFPK